MMFNGGETTSDEDRIRAQTQENAQSILSTTPNSTFLRKQNTIERDEEMNTETQNSEGKFLTPKKFSTNFEKLFRQKAKQTILKIKNRYEVLADSSEAEDEIDKIVKKKKTAKTATQTTKK